MLRLKDITKNYKVAGGEIKVLKGLNINFRKNEFVSILGPSGCGKTTTLNIVGGLDKYTSGDLIISGKSTKNFNDRDWDVYRNHRIGFIFQSYNLIPHQTVLGNVELALTISGVGKEERIKRAINALDKVGLQGEYYKRPNQLSGGQCQRVAIARALVNEPDILLADEPTGALDSKTSVQIMDLIKEISKDKLVIMVTHNADIAEKYSTRIIRLVDGEVIEDTNPYSEEDEIKESQKVLNGSEKKQKAKMSLWTAFKLSARNLFTKRGRTALTSIAGSIGIIGISAVLAVSTGVRTFINNMQDDMLSGNPIVVEETGYDFSAITNSMEMQDAVEMVKEKGYVNVDSMLEYLAKQYETLNTFINTNEITQDYVNYVSNMPKEYGTIGLDYGIDITNNIYTDYVVTSSIKDNISLSAIRSVYTSIMNQTQFKEQSSLIASLSETFMQAIPDSEYILSQYDLVDGGKVATEKNEVMIVINKDQALTDLALAQLGYYTQEEFMELIYAVDEDDTNNPKNKKERFSFDELKEKTFAWYSNDVVFNENPSNPGNMMKNIPFTYNDSSSEFTLETDENSKVELKVVGVLMPKEGLNFGCLSAGMYYTEELTKHLLQSNLNSKVVEYMGREGNEIDSYGGRVVNGVAQTVFGSPMITYDYTYYYEDYENPLSSQGVVGSLNLMSGLMAGMGNLGGASSSGDIYSLTMRELGGNDVAKSIKIYPKDFDTKDLVTNYLDCWNDEIDVQIGDKVISFEDRTEITYTDTLSLVISMINTMIDVVTIALIAFTSLSLVVSSVMIAIITYVSVVERVKEIGVIRSLGGRKRDVSNLFNAETLILGLASGLFGVGVTYAISIIVNMIVKSAAGFSIMILPLSTALIMIALSVGLTVLAGIIPSKKAAHQDPVVALRTE